MYTPISPGEMRQVVLNRFQQYHADKITRDDLDERMHIEGGRAVAYCYRVDTLFAMWMVPIGLVQFYDDQGNMLQTIDLTARASSEKRVA